MLNTFLGIRTLTQYSQLVGISPGQLMPSGETKNGTAEAALVGAEKIQHNNSIDELARQFPGSEFLQ